MDPENTGRVGPTEAALFLKKSGLPDSTLGKVSYVMQLSYAVKGNTHQKRSSEINTSS